MTTLRNLGRRKLRTTLTVLGITIGIWALVVFSSMANKINGLVATGGDYYVGKVVVSDGSSSGLGIGIVPIDVALAARFAAMDGVGAVVPVVQLPLDEDASGFGMPKVIAGSVAGADAGLDHVRLQPAAGRLLSPGDEGSSVAVLGSDLARQLESSVGDSVVLHGRSFDVVGVLQPTLTSPDMTVLVPLAAAQELFLATLPPNIGAALQADELATQIVVYPRDIADTESLADQIDASASEVTTMTAADFDQQVGATTLIFNAIIIGVAVISLVVGGLSVINTMAMSVAERTREIGIKRAIGASRRRVVSELVRESGLIGVIGGLTGLLLGWVVVVIANELGRTSGVVLFDLTPGTALFAVAFSTVLGMVAGVIPAWSAARLDPVAALRYE